MVELARPSPVAISRTRCSASGSAPDNAKTNWKLGCSASEPGRASRQLAALVEPRHRGRFGQDARSERAQVARDLGRHAVFMRCAALALAQHRAGFERLDVDERE